MLPHVMELAKRLESHLLLVHVADGWVARNFEQLKLAESEEMRADRAYLEKTAAKLRAEGLSVTAHLALGDPPREILKTAETENCDLIAMTSHGHRLLGDLLFGSTIHEVRHNTSIPVLLVRAAS
jgi:manganese transport protein